MSREFGLCILTILFVTCIQSSTFNRKYVVKKDMFSGPKADQYSIYADQTEKDLRYRIESYFSSMQKISLLTYPYKKPLGRLDAQAIGNHYDARIEVLDTRNTSNKWFTGHIRRVSAWFSDKYNIFLAERTITMKSKFLSSKFKFFNEAGKLVAMFKKRHFSPTTTYDLEIFSETFPDSIYLLALAVYDHKPIMIVNNADNKTNIAK